MRYSFFTGYNETYKKEDKDMLKKYYFEVVIDGNYAINKISKEEAYGVLHMYGFSNDDWKGKEIVICNNERKMKLIKK